MVKSWPDLQRGVTMSLKVFVRQYDVMAVDKISREKKKKNSKIKENIIGIQTICLGLYTQRNQKIQEFDS